MKRLITILLIALLIAHVPAAHAQEETAPEQLSQECQDLLQDGSAHHDLTQILSEALDLAAAGEAEVYAKSGALAMIVAVRIARCGNRWLFIKLQRGYKPWGLKWKGVTYGFVTHFLPSEGKAYIMKEVRRYDLNLLKGITTLQKILSRIFLVIIVFTCPPGEYGIWCFPGPGEPAH